MIEGPVGQAPGEDRRGRRAGLGQQDHHREGVPAAPGQGGEVDDVDAGGRIAQPGTHRDPAVGDTEVEQGAAEGLGCRLG